jgi:hypothetical protein
MVILKSNLLKGSPQIFLKLWECDVLMVGDEIFRVRIYTLLALLVPQLINTINLLNNMAKKQTRPIST